MSCSTLAANWVHQAPSTAHSRIVSRAIALRRTSAWRPVMPTCDGGQGGVTNSAQLSKKRSFSAQTMLWTPNPRPQSWTHLVMAVEGTVGPQPLQQVDRAPASPDPGLPQQLPYQLHGAGCDGRLHPIGT